MRFEGAGDSPCLGRAEWTKGVHNFGLIGPQSTRRNFKICVAGELHNLDSFACSTPLKSLQTSIPSEMQEIDYCLNFDTDAVP